MAKILIVDDKQDNLITISVLIKNLIPDCEVITGSSGAEGIEKARSALPDTILLDVKMPQMDGYEVCKVLKSDKMTRYIPIIMLTAIHRDIRSRIKGLENGADAFLTKPVDEAELAAQVKAMLRIKKAEDMLRREKKLLEEKVQERTRQLFQAQKMEAIGLLAGGIAHDFNNLLTTIKNSTSLVIAKTKGENSLSKDLEIILSTASRATKLTRQLLLFSRKQPLNPTLIDLNKTIENLLKMLNRIIGADIKITVHLASDLWTIKADEGNIEQVIMNLVVNAKDAMPKGGVITIETRNMEPEESFFDISGTNPDKFVCLSITDTGMGIDKSIIQQIFDPFFTTKGPENGTGLGLAVVYGIVKHHQGYIDVDSNPDHGSAFKVYLPAISSL